MHERNKIYGNDMDYGEFIKKAEARKFRSQCNYLHLQGAGNILREWTPVCFSNIALNLITQEQQPN